MTGTWTHPENREVITRAAIEGLVATYRSSPRERQRRMAWDQLHRIGVQLHEITADLERKLWRGYEILEQDPDEAREERWRDWLKQYERACDALSLIEHRAVTNEPDKVTQRRDGTTELRVAS
jgi:hypothetical protein